MSIKALLEYDLQVTDLMNQLMTDGPHGRGFSLRSLTSAEV